MTEVKGKPKAPALWHGSPPTRFLGGELDDINGSPCIHRVHIAFIKPARFTHELNQKLNVVASREFCELMQEALLRKRVGVRPRRPPCTTRRSDIHHGLSDPRLLHCAHRELVAAQTRANHRLPAF